jgi:hypothetical protein
LAHKFAAPILIESLAYDVELDLLIDCIIQVQNAPPVAGKDDRSGGERDWGTMKIGCLYTCGLA